MIKKKTIALLLAIIMQFSLMPGICSAAQTLQLNKNISAATSQNKNNIISQDKALQIFCSAFPDITRDKDLFAEYQEQGYSLFPSWQIYDHKNGQQIDQQVINGSVNAQSGEILSMDYNPQSEFYLGKHVSLTQEEAQKIAQQFLIKIQPDKAATLKLKADDSSSYIYDRNLHLYYNFAWQREINGLSVDWDNIRIGVDAYTGLVSHYSYNWNEAGLPEPEKLLNREQLQIKLQNDIGLVACYRYDNNTYGQSSGKIIPVYQLNSASYFVDARSGSFLDYYGWKIPYKDVKAYDQNYLPLTNTAAINETPWPTKQIDPETAKKNAQDFFTIMGFKGEIRRSGGGTSSGPGYRDEHWSYSLQDSKQENKLQVNINAFTGDVVGFRLDNNNNGNKN